MSLDLNDIEALDLLHRATVAGVKRDAPDLTARQMAVLLSVYMTTPSHTVRGLSATLLVSKPAVTRALDRLSELGLIKRKTDEADRRSVLVQRTVKGSVFLREYGELIVEAARAMRQEGAATSTGVPRAQS